MVEFERNIVNEMIKCTFLGLGEVFEQGLSDKLNAAVTKFVKKNDETEL